MRRRKGLGLVGQVFLFTAGVSFFILFMVLGMLSGDQSRFNQKVNVQVDYQMSVVKQNAVLIVFLEDNIWRPENIQRYEYGDVKAKKLLALYYSTEGNTLWVEGQAKSTGEVRDDLKTYMEYKMEKYWVETIDPVEYRLEISGRTSNKQPLVVGSLDRGQGTEANYNLPAADGEDIAINMWVNKGDGALGVVDSG